MDIQRVIFFFLLMSIFLTAHTKLQPEIGNEIVSFTLFNYDNLIADTYENSDASYLKHLTKLLSQATNIPETEYLEVLKSPELSQETHPVEYMLKLNLKTREISGFYFVDTDV
jgi:hypothetical protein